MHARPVDALPPVVRRKSTKYQPLIDEAARHPGVWMETDAPPSAYSTLKAHGVDAVIRGGVLYIRHR